MSFFVISFDTPDAVAKAAVCACLKSLDGVQVSDVSYVVEGDRSPSGLFEQLKDMLQDGHLWVMQSWQSAESSYLERAMASPGYRVPSDAGEEVPEEEAPEAEPFYREAS
jgi:hypothetical protein